MSPAVARALAVMFLLTIFGVPALQHVTEIRREDRPEHSLPQAYDIFRGAAAAVRAGYDHAGSLVSRMLAANRVMMDEIDRYETALEEESVIARSVQPVMQSLLLRVGAGNEQAYPGQDGWLFYRPDVDYVIGPGFLEVATSRTRGRAADPVAAILQFRDQLASRGITLVVFPTPVKPSVHPEKFERFASEPGDIRHNTSYAPFRQRLTDQGVLVFDGAAVLEAARSAGGESQYLATDTHWRPEAMQRIAAALAEYVAQHVPLPDEGAPGFTVADATLANLGDVAVMLRLPDDQTRYEKESVRVQKVLAADGTLWAPTADADVLLLGDSFSNIYSLEGMGWGAGAGLAEHLSLGLDRPVDCILRNDNAAFATREMLSRALARGKDRLAGKRVVIWQFAARELASGDWKLLDLELGTPPPRTFVVPPPGESMVVTGTIAAITAAPKPGTVPYADHIVAAHLVDLEAEGREIRGGEAIVYLWSMRANILTPAASYRAGQTLLVNLTPWTTVANELERFNRNDLPDETLQFEEPCWGEVITAP